MEPDELKKLRNDIGARQKDMAEILTVPARTYQNWEQQKESQAHRQIPDDYADRVRCLHELLKGRKGKSVCFQEQILWQQVPLRRQELQQIKRAAMLEDKTTSAFIREALLEKLAAPRNIPSFFDEDDEDDGKEPLW